MFKYIVDQSIKCPHMQHITYNHDHQQYLIERKHQWMKHRNHQWMHLPSSSSLSPMNILQLHWLYQHIYLIYAQKNNTFKFFLIEIEQQMNTIKQLQLKPIHKLIIHEETKLSYDRASSTITCTHKTKYKGAYYVTVRQVSTITFQQTIYTTKLKKDTTHYHLQNMKVVGYKTILFQQQLKYSLYPLQQGSAPEQSQAQTITLSYQTLKLTQTSQIILIPYYLGCVGQIRYWAMHYSDSIWIVGIHNVDQKITSAQFHLPEPNIVCNCFGLKDMGIYVIYEHQGNIVMNVHSPNEEDKFNNMNTITLTNMEYVSTLKGKDKIIIVSKREGGIILTELQMINKNIIYSKMLDELHVADGHLFDVMCQEICSILG